MGTLSQSVDYHFETGLVTIKARGVLDVPGASALRATMLKWLVEHPLCLIVDLSQVEVADAIALTVLPAVAKRDEAAPILVVVDSSTQTGLVIEQHLRTRISVFRDEASAAQAALAGETGSRRRLHMHMWSDKSAPA